VSTVGDGENPPAPATSGMSVTSAAPGAPGAPAGERIAEPPQGTSRTLKNLWLAVLALFLVIPWLGLGEYPLHLIIVALIWSYIYTSWAIMGRLGMVSFGHGAFMGIGAYSVVLLWNGFGVSPWLGAVVGVGLALIVALVIGYPCFRFRIIGHYFALVTLALAEVVRLVIIALRDYTGGSLGITPKGGLVDGASASLYAMQFASKTVWFYIALAVWLIGLILWKQADQHPSRRALQAISEDEDAAASIGIPVARTKLAVTLLSAGMTALGGVLYAQYQLYVNPDTVSGIAISLQMVFGAIAGGMFVRLGPTVGAMFLLALSEALRVLIGNEHHGVDMTVYGALLILFIIFMPKGILGTVLRR
jgi:branched-chain amino acid transport system permease protein